jgi:hypothetical protein
LLLKQGKNFTQASLGKVNLNFSWSGPTSVDSGCAREGGKDVGHIDIVFQGMKGKLSVELPPNISPEFPEKRMFIGFPCR